MSRDSIENTKKSNEVNHNENLPGDSNRDISPYNELRSAREDKDSDKAHDLFALFTADIIKENKIFTR